MITSDRVITIAREYVGCVETGKNKAPWLKDLMDSGRNPTNWQEGEPYCIAALLSIFNLACLADKKKIPFPFSKSTQTFYENARKAHYVSAMPSIGDIVIFQLGNTWQGHAGLVTDIIKTDKGIPYAIATIEYNTSGHTSGDQRNGEGCYAKIRHFRDFEPTRARKLWIKGFVKTSII